MKIIITIVVSLKGDKKAPLSLSPLSLPRSFSLFPFLSFFIGKVGGQYKPVISCWDIPYPGHHNNQHLSIVQSYCARCPNKIP